MSHYDIHVGDVIKYPEMVMARTDYEHNTLRMEQLITRLEITKKILIT